MTALGIPESPLERIPEIRIAVGDRSLFPELGWKAYLGHAAIAPSNLAVVRHVDAALADLAALGAGAFLRWELSRRRLVGSLERVLGAEKGTVALTAGTSYGLTALALALPLRPREKLVTFRGEFPANVTPWALAAHRFGAELELLPAPNLELESPSDAIVDDVARALERGARYVLVSAVQFQTGFAMPLRRLGELCEKRGAFLLVDAIQATGAVPLDVKEARVSALAGGAHKWLLGTEGAGYLYVDPEFMKKLSPLTAGWLSHHDGEKFLFEGSGFLDYESPLRSDVSVFEGSSANVTGHAALEAGVALLESLGIPSIFEHLQAYHDGLEPHLVDLGCRSLRARAGEGRSGILSVELPPGHHVKTVAASLRQEGVFPSTPDGCLRFAPHFANSKQEIEFVAHALKRALGR